MSVFQLNKAHVDALVTAGIQLGVIKTEKANVTGRMLLEQHYRSVGFLLDNDPSPGYRATIASFQIHPIAILKIIACYDYQTCEGRDWDSSTACEWSRRLHAEALRRLPQAATQITRTMGIPLPAYRALPVWENTPWGVVSLDDIPTTGDVQSTLPTTRRGLPVDILTERNGSFSNGGLSAHLRSVVIVDIDGAPTPDFACIAEPSENRPAVSLRFEYGRYVARPTDEPERRFMASGAFVHTSDSRWGELIGHSLPIPLHDRTE